MRPEVEQLNDGEVRPSAMRSSAGFRLPVYLDGHATMPLSADAAMAMAPWWSQRAANAHSPHARGQEAARAVEQAREQVASLVGASPSEIVFTSGATESNNLALLGAVEAARAAGITRREIIVSAIEHKSVLSCADELSRRGWEVLIAPADGEGLLDLGALQRLVSQATLLVAVMAANNEIGTIQPVDEAVSIARAAGAMIHVDAAQAVGKIPFNVAEADFASISSHKLGGPPGVGALFVSAAAPYRPRPLFFGGAQEGGLRPGTIPVPLVVGFGAAAALAAAQLSERAKHQRRLADRFLAALSRAGIPWKLNGSPTERLPGSLNLRVTGLDAASMIARLTDRVCFAEGSACTGGEILPSHVLTSIGLTREEAAGSLRIYCSPMNSEAEIDFAAAALIAEIRQI